MNTKFKTASDFRKSLEARLQGLATKTDMDLQRLRRKVAFDRFLARIFTQEKPGFFLKGGYAMELRIANARATKDIDLTCIRRVKNESELLSELILIDLQKLAGQDLNDHFIRSPETPSFRAGFIYQVGKAQIDLENAPYGGARYPVSALIDKKLFVRFQPLKTDGRDRRQRESRRLGSFRHRRRSWRDENGSADTNILQKDRERHAG